MKKQLHTRIITEEDEWNSLVVRSHFYDVYHMHSYSMLETTGRSVLFSVTDNNGNFIALPLVIRPIEGYDYYDCTSVYGYPGPISNLPFDEVPEDLIKSFQNELTAFFDDSSIISAFTRTNPLNPSAITCFKNMGELVTHNKTVVVDLSLTDEQNWSNYREPYRRSIKKLQRSGYEVAVTTSCDELPDFTDMYQETMRRVNAAPHYFFDTNYFRNMLEAADIDSKLMLVYLHGTLAAGVILTSTNGIMQYHLGGTRTAFLKDAPMKLIVHSAVQIAKQEGLKYLHLGGGTTGSEDDPLFNFKKGFSDNFCDFVFWRMVVDENAYNEVVNDCPYPLQEHSSYFPLYRRYIPAKPVMNLQSVAECSTVE